VSEHDNSPGVLMRKRVAHTRKPFLCGQCRKLVVYGDGYCSEAGVWDGAWKRRKRCLECVAKETP
jgi:hypothetical protein